MAEFKITIADESQLLTSESAGDNSKIGIRVELDPVPASIEEYTPAQLYGLRLLELIDMDRQVSEERAAENNIEEQPPQE